jgi:two-component system LytT family sensor kinase
MDKNRKIAIEWIYPTVWGVIMYNVLRAVTDLTHHGIFWEGELKLHIIALLLSIVICFLLNTLWRRQLRKTVTVHNMIRDYLFVVVQLLVLLNFLLIIGQKAGVLFMGAGWIDYMLINVIYVPLLLIFYTLIRNNIIEKKVKEKVVLLEKLRVEKNNAELEFLKSQYHPHFLFNALNTIYFQIDDNNTDAKRSIEHLSELLRYQLYDVNQEVQFSKEIKYLRSYIAFQQLRKTEKLIVNIDIDTALEESRVHPLLFQPLLENAFKYVSGTHEIDLKLKLRKNDVYFELKNSVSDVMVSTAVKDSGIGLTNLKRKLELLYPEKYQLMKQMKGGFFKVTLILQIQ